MERSNALRAHEAFDAALYEELQAKGSFYDNYPYKILKVMGHYWGGLESDSKRHMKDAIDWYDALDNKAKCHRAVQPMFVVGSRCRQQAELWLNSQRPLHAFDDLMHNLLGLALNEIVEQRLEGMRAQIGNHDLSSGHMKRILPSSVCADLRAPEWIELCGRVHFA
eukprot:1611956-Pyramimonas_sp.AAC.1